jgi:hypothetical protein
MGGMKNHLIKVLEAPVSKVEARRAAVSVNAHDSVRGDTGGQQHPHSVAALPGLESNSAVWSDAATLRWWRRRFAGCLSLGLLASSLVAGGELGVARIGAWEGYFLDLALVGDRYVCLTEGTGGLELLDISDLANPRSTGLYQTNDFVGETVKGRGPNAFVSAGDKGLWAFDIATPDALKRVGACEEIRAYDFVISGDHAYVCGGGLHVIDLSNPTNLVRVATLSNVTGGVVATGKNHVFVAGYAGNCEMSLVAVDIADPAHPMLRGTVNMLRCHGQIADLVCVGDYLYVTGGGYEFWGGYYYDGLVVFDITNPADPRRVAGFDLISTSYTGRILSLAHYVLVGVPGGFVVMDVTAPANPREVGRCSTTFNAEPMAVRGAQVFGRDNTGLVIFELLPFLNSITKHDPDVKLKWEGFGPAQLQRATRLTNPDWQDLPGFEGTNTATLPARDGAEFFRLVRPQGGFTPSTMTP